MPGNPDKEDPYQRLGHRSLDIWREVLREDPEIELEVEGKVFDYKTQRIDCDHILFTTVERIAPRTVRGHSSFELYRKLDEFRRGWASGFDDHCYIRVTNDPPKHRKEYDLPGFYQRFRAARFLMALVELDIIRTSNVLEKRMRLYNYVDNDSMQTNKLISLPMLLDRVKEALAQPTLEDLTCGGLVKKPCFDFKTIETEEPAFMIGVLSVKACREYMFLESGSFLFRHTRPLTFLFDTLAEVPYREVNKWPFRANMFDQSALEWMSELLYDIRWPRFLPLCNVKDYKRTSKYLKPCEGNQLLMQRPSMRLSRKSPEWVKEKWKRWLDGDESVKESSFIGTCTRWLNACLCVDSDIRPMEFHCGDYLAHPYGFCDKQDIFTPNTLINTILFNSTSCSLFLPRPISV